MKWLLLFLAMPAMAHDNVFLGGGSTEGHVVFSYHKIAEQPESPEPLGWYVSLAATNEDTVFYKETQTVVPKPGNSGFGHCQGSAKKCGDQYKVGYEAYADSEPEVLFNIGVNHQVGESLYPYLGVGTQYFDGDYELNVNAGLLYMHDDIGFMVGYNSTGSVDLGIGLRF